MLTKRIFTTLTALPKMYASKNVPIRRFSEKAKNANANQQDTPKPNPTLGDIGTKYQIFRDEDSDVILDVVEERLKYKRMLEIQALEYKDPLEGLNLERGKTGVFEIEDLVAVLKRENAENLFVATVPADFKYVNHICVVNGKSQRHMNAIAQFVKRIFKHKRNDQDIIPRLEGSNSKDWMALDLGNIALHIFSREARIVYDIDSLWALGPEFDKECNKQDPVVEMLERHSMYLRDLVPAN